MTPATRRPSAGPSFASGTARARPRLVGASDTLDGLVADADACTLHGRPLSSAEDFLAAVRGGQLAHLDGAFALAWTTPDGALCLARDPIGHRTLYYCQLDGRLFFASSLRALLSSSELPRRLNLRSVATYLSYAYVPGRDTMVEGAFEVLPGERLTFARGAITRHPFWAMPGEPTTFAPEEELVRSLRWTLEETVRGMLPSNEPVAASLSGGIDSSLIVALAKRLHAGPVRTFSITFGKGYKDELPWSTLVAEHCATEHTVVELSPEAIAAHLDDTYACLDKPNGDPLTVPNALLFRTMAEHASVVLNGEGGDPCFGGPKNVPMLLSALYGDGSGEEAPLLHERSYLRAHLKCFDDLPELLTGEALREACTPPLEEDLTPWFTDERWGGLVARLMAMNVRFKGGHHILPKVDALSAPFGVLARSPLFARTIVEVAATIPAELKLRGSSEKYILKQAVRDLLPGAVVDRPKSGMMVPVEGWFQGPLLPQARARLLDGLGPYRLFERRYLEDLLAGKIGGLRPRHGVKLWLLVGLEAHLRALGVRPR